MRQNNLTWAALALLGLVALLYFLNSRFPGALADEDGRMRLVYLLGWLSLIGSSVIVGWRHNAGLALKQALAWIAIAFTLVVIYSYKDDLMGVGHRLGGRVVSSLVTARPVQATPGVVYLSRDMRSGHFHVDALVNGTVVNFLVDTGASDVALSTDDARRLGFDLDKLNYNMAYQTANGTTMAAQVKIDEIKVGDIAVRNVRASIGRGNANMSLLGMTFLNRIGSIEVKGDRLVLRQ
jgi:aspartyl protease family protein